jgi:glycosyltransferase involved in cell wall biosynthesis
MAGLINHFGRSFRHAIIALDGVSTCRCRLSPDVDVQFPAVEWNIRNPAAAIVHAWRSLRRIRPDILLTYNWGAMDWAFAHSLHPSCRHLHFEDGFGPQEADRQLRRRVLFRRIGLRQAFRVVVPSTTLQSIAIREWRLPAERVVLIPNGVHCERYATSRFDSPQSAHGNLVIGTVAPLRAEKNLGLLIEVVAELCSRHPISLIIAGDGPERRGLETRARDLGVADRVHFLGHVEEVAEVLATVDVYALCSMTEQLPISLLEAMAAAKAVAAVDVGDVARALSAENRRYVAAKSDPAGFKKALESLLVDGDLRARLAAANRRKAREDYGYGRMASAYQALLAA